MRLRALKRSHAKSVGGVWWDFETQDRVSEPHPEHLCFLVGELHNPKHRETSARLRIARLDDLKAGGDRAQKALDEITDRAVAETILLGWRNLDGDDGKPIDYSADAAYAILRDPDNWPVKHFIMDVASLARGYALQSEADAVGN